MTKGAADGPPAVPADPAYGAGPACAALCRVSNESSVADGCTSAFGKVKPGREGLSAEGACAPVASDCPVFNERAVGHLKVSKGHRAGAAGRSAAKGVVAKSAARLIVRERSACNRRSLTAHGVRQSQPARL